jgi:hypothetical protein
MESSRPEQTNKTFSENLTIKRNMNTRTSSLLEINEMENNNSNREFFTCQINTGIFVNNNV